MPLSAGDRLGPYEITGELGAGGMGIVLRAHDTELNREVALKILPDAFAADPDRLARFQREAQVLASLNHPGIAAIYGIAQAPSTHAGQATRALVLELVDGPTLADRIGQGPMPIEDALPIAVQIVEALAAAHDAGVIHRDLKPANVKVKDDGTVKLLDFGLARPIADDTRETAPELTLPGRIFGTPAYMAPEQLSGSSVDARADLFAAGALLFELLSGRSPFAGDSPMASFHAVMYERPPALTGSTSIDAVDRIIHRALEKKPADRYQTAKAMADDIQAALAGSDSGEVPVARAVTRLVVLPFRALPPDPDTDFLAVGLADALTGSLSGIESLVVRSSLAATGLSREAPDLKKIATELDVDAVLAGTLMRAGDRLRVSAQLLEAPAGTVLWSQNSQSDLDDLFALQDDFTQRIVESLAIPLSRREEQLLKRDVPATARAYEFYLRGNQQAYSHRTIEVARDLYLQCLAEDPRYAPAWARLGRVYRLLGEFGDRAATAETLQKAEDAFTRALDINPELSLAHNLYAYLQVDLGRAQDAMLRLLERVDEHRADPDLFAGLVHACRYCGLLEASVAAYEKAHRLDPNIRTSVCQTFWMMDDIRRAIQTEPDDDPMMGMLAALRQGRTAEVIAELRKRAQGARGAESASTIALLAALEGKRDDFVESFDAYTPSIRDPENLYYSALIAAYVGDTDRTLDTLQRTVDGGWFCHATMAREPWLEGVCDDPRFIAIVRRAAVRHGEAAAAFTRAGGDRLLGLKVPA